jgi:MFS family permease
MNWILVLVLVAILFAFGRGANGSSGPFAPAEQAWLASSIPDARRGSLFSLNAALTFWGMGIGSFLAGILPGLMTGRAVVVRYDPLFWLTIVVAMINLVQIWFTPEPPRGRREKNPSQAAQKTEQGVRQRENKALTLLALVNIVNSLGVGLIAPLLPYWFSVRFGVGPSAIGPVYGFTFLLTGLSSLVVGRLSDRIGLMGSIIWPRLIGVVAWWRWPLCPPLFGPPCFMFSGRWSTGGLWARVRPSASAWCEISTAVLRQA